MKKSERRETTWCPDVSSSHEISTCELGDLGTDDEVNDELKDYHGLPPADPGGFKKTKKWYEVIHGI